MSIDNLKNKKVVDITGVGRNITLKFSDGSLLMLGGDFKIVQGTGPSEEECEKVAEELTKKYSQSRQFIKTIKEFRENTGMPLLESRQMIERFWGAEQERLYAKTKDMRYTFYGRRF